jgi:hypothetical protein
MMIRHIARGLSQSASNVGWLKSTISFCQMIGLSSCRHRSRSNDLPVGLSSTEQSRLASIALACANSHAGDWRELLLANSESMATILILEDRPIDRHQLTAIFDPRARDRRSPDARHQRTRRAARHPRRRPGVPDHSDDGQSQRRHRKRVSRLSEVRSMQLDSSRS